MKKHKKFVIIIILFIFSVSIFAENNEIEESPSQKIKNYLFYWDLEPSSLKIKDFKEIYRIFENKELQNEFPDEYYSTLFHKLIRFKVSKNNCDSMLYLAKEILNFHNTSIKSRTYEPKLKFPKAYLNPTMLNYITIVQVKTERGEYEDALRALSKVAKEEWLLMKADSSEIIDEWHGGSGSVSRKPFFRPMVVSLAEAGMDRNFSFSQSTIIRQLGAKIINKIMHEEKKVVNREELITLLKEYLKIFEAIKDRIPQDTEFEYKVLEDKYELETAINYLEHKWFKKELKYYDFSTPGYLEYVNRGCCGGDWILVLANYNFKKYYLNITAKIPFSLFYTKILFNYMVPKGPYHSSILNIGFYENEQNFKYHFKYFDFIQINFDNINDREIYLDSKSLHDILYSIPINACRGSQIEFENFGEVFTFVRNFIYAIHGYQFKTERWKEVFEKAEWYKPNENFNEGLLSPNEIKNVKYLKKWEDLLKKNNLYETELKPNLKEVELSIPDSTDIKAIEKLIKILNNKK